MLCRYMHRLIGYENEKHRPCRRTRSVEVDGRKIKTALAAAQTNRQTTIA